MSGRGASFVDGLRSARMLFLASERAFRRARAARPHVARSGIRAIADLARDCSTSESPST